MNCSTPGLPVHHQLPEFTQTHVHRVCDAIQPSHPLSSPFPPAPNPSQHQSQLFTWGHPVQSHLIQWQPTPVLLSGESHGWRSLVGCSPWGRWESDTTERLNFHFSFSCIGEGNGNPLQYSCLENPRDGGVCWVAIYGVAQSRTRLKRLSSSSNDYLLSTCYIPDTILRIGDIALIKAKSLPFPWLMNILVGEERCKQTHLLCRMSFGDNNGVLTEKNKYNLKFDNHILFGTLPRP